jgi:hypothetical protein
MRWLLLVLVLTARPHDASADTPTRVKVKRIGQRIGLTLTYRVKVARPSAGRLELDVPRDLVITGARVTAGGRTHVLAMQSSTAASAALDQLTGEAAEKPTRSSFAIAAPGGIPAFVYAVPKAGTIQLTLELESSGCWYRNARYAMVPAAWARIARSKVTAPPTCPTSTEDDMAWIRVADPRKRGLSAEASAIDVTVGAPLSQVPPDLSTVLVVDGSRSMTADQRASQRALVASYLKHVPRTQVQVVAFARTATPLLPAWSQAGDVDAKIDLALSRLAPANGSAVDAAVAEAGTWLKQVRGPRRVVLFTDGLFARAVASQVPDLAATLPADTLVHVVTVDDAPELEPDVRSTLAELAADTRGRTYRGRGDATLLTRPTSLDHVRVDRAGWNLELTSCDPVVFEGSSCITLLSAPLGASELSIHGTLWSEPVVVPIVPDFTQSVAAARELAPNVSVAALAEAATIVTEDRWLYAEHGATSAYGASWETIGNGHFSTLCKECSGPAAPYGPATTLTPRTPPLVAQLEALTDHCRDKGAVDVELDITGVEIADVKLTAGVPATQRQCLETALWGASLAPYSTPITSPFSLRVAPLQ